MGFGEMSGPTAGAGGNTKKLHIPKLLEIDGVSICAIANRSAASAEAVVNELALSDVAVSSTVSFRMWQSLQHMSCYLSPILQVSGDWQQVVEHPEVDAVVIGTWPYLHHTLVLAALRANKHVLTEARMVRVTDLLLLVVISWHHICCCAGDEPARGQGDVGRIPKTPTSHHTDSAKPYHAAIRQQHPGHHRQWAAWGDSSCRGRFWGSKVLAKAASVPDVACGCRRFGQSQANLLRRLAVR